MYYGLAGANATHRSNEIRSVSANSKCSLMQTHLRSGTRLSLNGENVRTARRFVDSPGAQELTGHARKVTAFLPIHRIFGLWLVWIGRRSCLHLDEREHRSVVADHINFALEARRRVVTRDENVSVAAEILVSVGLAANSGAARSVFRRVLTGCVRETLAGCKVHRREHETREHGSYFTTSSRHSTVLPRMMKQR